MGTAGMGWSVQRLAESPRKGLRGRYQGVHDDQCREDARSAERDAGQGRFNRRQVQPGQVVCETEWDGGLCQGVRRGVDEDRGGWCV